MQHKFTLKRLVLCVAALALFGWVVRGVVPYHSLPYNPSVVDSIIVAGDRLSGESAAFHIRDQKTVSRINSLLKYSAKVGVHTGGLEWLELRMMSGDRQVASIWVGDYAEWGYNGKIEGYSNELQSLVIELIEATPP